LYGPPQLVVIRERTPPALGKGGDRFGFFGEKVLEEARRPAHGLARVIENVVEPWQSLHQEPREELDARGMPQIETVDLQTLVKDRVIRLLRVPVGRVDGKAGGDDDVRTGPQELERCLKADLDPSAGNERIVAVEVSGLPALGTIEVAARMAHGVVVAMHLHEGLLADVA